MNSNIIAIINSLKRKNGLSNNEFSRDVKINKNLNVIKDTIINGNLTFGGNINYDNSIGIGIGTGSMNVNNITITSKLYVGSDTRLVGDVKTDNNLYVFGSTTVAGSLYINDSSIFHAATILGALYVSGNSILSGDVTIGNESNKIGFYGTEPVLKQQVDISETNTTTLSNLLNALSTCGLIFYSDLPPA